MGYQISCTPLLFMPLFKNTDEGEKVEEDESSKESATNSSVEDDEVIHSTRAHKSLSKHAVLSESDTDNEDVKPKVCYTTELWCAVNDKFVSNMAVEYEKSEK